MRYYLLIAVVLAFAVCEDDKLVSVVGVARHGARAPNVIYPLAADEAKNFKRPGELTALGMR